MLGSTADVPGSTSDVLSSVLESTSGGERQAILWHLC